MTSGGREVDAFVYYTERKLKNKKWGRPGNEATIRGPHTFTTLLLLCIMNKQQPGNKARVNIQDVHKPVVNLIVHVINLRVFMFTCFVYVFMFTCFCLFLQKKVREEIRELTTL